MIRYNNEISAFPFTRSHKVTTLFSVISFFTCTSRKHWDPLDKRFIFVQ